jgi:hypothetical protein
VSEELDATDFVFDLGPDRDLPCGCRIINGVICFVAKVEGLDLDNLYERPGKFISVDGSMDGK